MKITNPEETVICPSCKGTKLNFAGSTSCLCCQGVGEITKKHAELLSSISIRIRQKCLERGIDLGDTD